MIDNFVQFNTPPVPVSIDGQHSLKCGIGFIRCDQISFVTEHKGQIVIGTLGGQTIATVTPPGEIVSQMKQCISGSAKTILETLKEARAAGLSQDDAVAVLTAHRIAR